MAITSNLVFVHAPLCELFTISCVFPEFRTWVFGLASFCFYTFVRICFGLRPSVIQAFSGLINPVRDPVQNIIYFDYWNFENLILEKRPHGGFNTVFTVPYECIRTYLFIDPWHYKTCGCNCKIKNNNKMKYKNNLKNSPGVFSVCWTSSCRQDYLFLKLMCSC